MSKTELSVYNDGVSDRTKNRRIVLRKSKTDGVLILEISSFNPINGPHVQTVNRLGLKYTAMKVTEEGIDSLIRTLVTYRKHIK